MLSPVIANDRAHLEGLIRLSIASHGLQCNLNHIDVSAVDDFSCLFQRWPEFNGDISRWDTSSATSMESMFCQSEFNGTILQWNTSKVTDMDCMFKGSKFNGDISGWDVSNVESMAGMFAGTNFDQDVSKWNVSSVHRMENMFSKSAFNQDISQWNVCKVWNFSNMFAGGVFAHDISAWPLQKGAQLPSFYQGNSLFLAAQSMEPWIIGLHLKNEVIPTIPEWGKAFANVQALALSLDLTTAQHVAAIVEAHSFIVQSVNPAGSGETPVDNAVFETQLSVV